MSDTLFELPPPLFVREAKPLGPKDTRKPGEKFRAKQIAMFARGIHPVTKMPLLGADVQPPGGARCGNCDHLRSHTLAKTYYKCGAVKMTGGPATDVRLKWPACTAWERERDDE